VRIHVSMNTRLNGEDGYDAGRRGENTSRLETKLGSQMEGLHAEDHPELVGMIKSAQQAQETAAEEVEKEWLAAQADGTVARMKGEPDIAKLVVPTDNENEIDALRKLRLAQMKGAAEERKRWLEMGHGKYDQLDREASFLQQITKHERVVCALCAQGSLDGELLHSHMRALCKVHLETYFCWLDPETAPVMMGMVDMGRLPALLLCMGGKVVHHLHGLDRSFTAEGVAYELGQHHLVNFEEGTQYTHAKNGCTTKSAEHAGSRRRLDPDSDDSDDDGDISD
jgi:hypothetical protein